MVDERNIRGYIGGSDANKIYGSFDTKTFGEFWDERVSGIKLNSFSTLDTSVGNIMESKILDEVGVDRKYWNIFKVKPGTIAGINTDALTDSAYHEIKTSLPEYVLKWLSGKKITAAYRRQLMHGLYVTGRGVAYLHVLPMTEDEKACPFGLDISGKVHTFEFNKSDFNIQEHDVRIRYLTQCYESGIRPSDSDFKNFIK